MELKAGYKMTEVGVIPDDWEIKKLKDITEKITVGIASAATHAYRDKGIVMFRNQNIKCNYLDDNDILYISPEFEALYKGKRLKAGDLLTARTGYPGTTCLVPSEYEGAQSFTTLITRTNIKKVESYFLCFYINSEAGQEFFETNQIGGGQKNVNAGSLKLMPIPIPPTKSEQIAIATALSDADTLISSLKKLVAKKRNIKQGAMQKLLQPNEGWEVKKLGDVLDIRKGQLITESTRVNGTVPVIAGGKSAAYFHNKPNRTGKTITISASGASAGYVSFHDYPIFASDCSTIQESSNYSIEFVFYLLQLLQEKIYRMQTGGAQPHIHASDLNPIEIPFPTKEEQDKVAIIFFEMDAEINALETKLEKYRNIKLGMMQNLLTGKIRLV